MYEPLPEAAVIKILSRLPAADVIACRCVCRRWNNLLRSDAFLRLHADASPRCPWILTRRSGPCFAAYSPHPDRWRRLPIPTCEHDLSVALPLASSRGIIAYCLSKPHYPHLVVCNPLTSAVRTLPLMNYVRFIDIAGMHESDGFYQIMVSGWADPLRHVCVTELYDSRAGQWVICSRYSDNYPITWYDCRTVWLDGRYYYMAEAVHLGEGLPLFAYDVRERRWEELGVRMAPENLVARSLVVCGGKLLLTGIVHDDTSADVVTVGVWKVDWERREWVLVGTMPDELLRQARTESLLVLRCVGTGHLVWFSIHGGWPIASSITYNLLDGEWRWLPETGECGRRPVPAGGFGTDTLVGLLFEPNFLTNV